MVQTKVFDIFTVSKEIKVKAMDINTSMWTYFLKGNEGEDRVKLVYLDRYIFMSEFKETVLRVATYLQSQGIKKGDVVGIMLPNTPEAVFSFYAINSIGAIASIIDPRLGEVAVWRLLNSAKHKLILVTDMAYRNNTGIFDNLKIKVILCNVFTYAKFPYSLLSRARVPGFTYFKDMLTCEPALYKGVDDGDAPAVYMHSGGTTGVSKTAVITSKAFNHVSEGVLKAIHPDNKINRISDKMLIMLPVFHAFGLGVAIHGILPHINGVLMPKFNAISALRLMGKYKITHIAGIPYMYRKLDKSRFFNKRNVSSVKYAFCGGDRMPNPLKQSINKKFEKAGSKAQILEGYGLTETSSVVTVNREGNDNLYTQGLPLDGTEVKIFMHNKPFEEVPVGEIGEIYVASPSLMIGYLNEGKEGPDRVIFKDAEGKEWLKTGDLGRVDEDGLLYFVERISRTMKIASNLVCPSEVEEVVTAMDEVNTCCAVRVNTIDSAHLKLYVQLHNRQHATEEMVKMIQDVVEKSISKYAVPREIEFVTRIERTALGKPNYRKYEYNEFNPKFM
ncbi:MAG TPA: class I adenylate-forming enzyme family protein [Clostridia bacterium]|nr:class I adenylate-forming enzyme family protein [Clostridia bacterium]